MMTNKIALLSLVAALNFTSHANGQPLIEGPPTVVTEAQRASLTQNTFKMPDFGRESFPVVKTVVDPLKPGISLEDALKEAAPRLVDNYRFGDDYSSDPHRVGRLAVYEAAGRLINGLVGVQISKPVRIDKPGDPIPNSPPGIAGDIAEYLDIPYIGQEQRLSLVDDIIKQGNSGSLSYNFAKNYLNGLKMASLDIERNFNGKDHNVVFEAYRSVLLQFWESGIDPGKISNADRAFLAVASGYSGAGNARAFAQVIEKFGQSLLILSGENRNVDPHGIASLLKWSMKKGPQNITFDDALSQSSDRVGRYLQTLTGRDERHLNQLLSNHYIRGGGFGSDEELQLILDVHERMGVGHFTRFYANRSLELLAHLLENENPSVRSDLPLVVVYTPHEGSSFVFDTFQFNRNIFDTIRDIRSDYKVVVREVASTDDILRYQKGIVAREGRSPEIVFMAGHGSPEALNISLYGLYGIAPRDQQVLGSGHHIYGNSVDDKLLDLSDGDFFTQFGRTMNGGDFIFYSCTVGGGKDSRVNLANVAAFNMPNVVVHAATEPTIGISHRMISGQMQQLQFVYGNERLQELRPPYSVVFQK